MPQYETDRIESRDWRELAAPLFFLVLSVVLIVLPVSYQESISFALRRSVLAPFIVTQEALQQARLRAGTISGIQIRMDSLSAVLISQSTIEEENRRLRSLLDLRDRAVTGFLPASAVRPGTEGSESMFLLDVGSEHGVSVSDPVVVAGGLIGVVREVGRETALAMDWTHPDFRVSVMTEDGQAFGIVEPRRGGFREEDRLLLNGVPFYTVIDEGELVVTSGQGSVYPRGIIVGTVNGAGEEDAGWRKSYWLEPAVAPGSATHVLVLIREGSDASSLGALWGVEEAIDSMLTVDQPPAGNAGRDAEDEAMGEP